MASSKRPRSEDGEIGEGSGRLTRSRSLIIVRDAKRAQISRPVLTREDLLPRRAMQEVRPLLTHSAPPVPRYQLRFQNCLPNCVFTCRKIMTKDKDPLQISMVDTATGDVVAFGPLSSENIMVLVLDGLFCGTKQKDKKEFKNHIVRQRDGKGPLLKGKLVIQLTDGVGYLQDISFTDNSSWTPSKKFRLAVCCETEGIQEGISDPFRVKELRSALNEKHHPPKLTDQVWNLEKIRKDGRYHLRLTEAGIHNVQQFLRALSSDPENLRMAKQYLTLLQNGSSPKRRIPDKEWEAIITNAQECIQEFNLVTESISLSVSCPQCSGEASRQVKFFESVAPYSQLGHTNQEDTSEQLIHPLLITGNFGQTIPPTHAAFPGQNLGSSCFSGYVQSEMPDTCNFQDVFRLEDVMDIQPEINNPLVNQLWLIPTSDDATVAKSNTSDIQYHVTENDQVELEQPSQEFFGHSHEALGFPDIGSEHVYPRCSSFSGSLGGLSDLESIWELIESNPMVLDSVRSTSKWVKLLAVLKWGLFAYLSTRKLGNTSDHPKELV